MSHRKFESDENYWFFIGEIKSSKNAENNYNFPVDSDHENLSFLSD